MKVVVARERVRPRWKMMLSPRKGMMRKNSRPRNCTENRSGDLVMALMALYEYVAEKNMPFWILECLAVLMYSV